jgi:hypothetical protein
MSNMLQDCNSLIKRFERLFHNIVVEIESPEDLIFKSNEIVKKYQGHDEQNETDQDATFRAEFIDFGFIEMKPERAHIEWGNLPFLVKE